MSTTTAELEPIPAPEPPPDERLSPAAWVRKNLLYSPAGAVLTVLAGSVAVWAVLRVVRFVFVSADWEIVRRNLLLFMIGRFPRGELWRVWAAAAVAALVIGLIAGARATSQVPARERARRWWPVALLAIVLSSLVRTAMPVLGLAALAAVALLARAAGRRVLATSRRARIVLLVLGVVAVSQLLVRAPGQGVDQWGGLMLTLSLALIAIGVSFPLGVLLALGRRSTLPAVRAVCVAYIELFRGVPLVTVLFMGDLLLGFFLPPGSVRPGAVTRALVGFIVFTSAYLAEIVRAGLQSVPPGQIEAAQALGLPTVRITSLIVLPQALRAVIPAIVGQFISLFKDTSLVATIGLLDLLAVSLTVTKQPDFLGQGLHAETLVFVSFVYWTGAYWMSRASQRLERKLGVGER